MRGVVLIGENEKRNDPEAEAGDNDEGSAVFTVCRKQFVSCLRFAKIVRD
jgi:hypothetical protein